MRLFNSLTRQVDEFVPINDKHVTIYVCGITPYDTTHLGHAFTYISFDLLVRTLQFFDYTVTYTQNVTDINDRDKDILQKAKEQNTSWDKLAAYWTEKFLLDMQSLNWTPPTNYLFASEQIPQMIEIIQQILSHGAAYVVHGGVYLDIEKVSDYGRLSKLPHNEMLTVAKEFDEDLTNPDKRHPLDITLWRPATDGQPLHIPSFDSPWGKGRPGWHIECSTMALTSLGTQIDIHGGGIDLIYPHHEDEIAQSIQATQESFFAKYWLHTGTVHINGEKMSKSLGNLVLVDDLLKTYSPDAIRWVLLSHHYRKAWEYNEQEFKDAEKSLQTLISRINAPDDKPSITNYKDLAREFLSADLNSPKLLTQLRDATSQPVSVQEAEDINGILLMMGFFL